MPKIIVPPTPENTYRGEEKFVKKLYATPTQIHQLFGVSRSTVYNWLKYYRKDNLGVENLYIDYSATGTLINISKLEEYLIRKHNKWYLEAQQLSDVYKSYLLAVLCFTVLAIVLMPFLYFTTAWSIAGFASIAIFIFYKEYFYEE